MKPLSHILNNWLFVSTSLQLSQMYMRTCVPEAGIKGWDYRKTSGINRTKSQNLNVSCILLQLSSLNPLKPGVKLRMKM